MKSYLASPLPVGMSEFESWSNDIIELVGPIADKDSLKYAMASQLMHLDHKVSSIPKQYFVRCLRKAAANQVASQVFQNIKQAQAEAQAKALEAEKNQQVEDTTIKADQSVS